MISARPLVNHRLLSCLMASFLILQMKEGAREAEPPHTPKATSHQPNKRHAAQALLGAEVLAQMLVVGLCPSTRSQATPLPLLHALTTTTSSVFFHRDIALSISLQSEVQLSPYGLWEPTFPCIPPELPVKGGRSLQTQKTTEMCHSAHSFGSHKLSCSLFSAERPVQHFQASCWRFYVIWNIDWKLIK